MSSSSWTKPSGAIVGSIGNLGVPQILIGVEAGSGEDLVITLGGAQNGQQDLCTPTTQVTASGASFPRVAISVASFPIRVLSKDPTVPWQAVTRFHDVRFEDILPGLDNMGSSKFEGVFEYAEFAARLSANSDLDAICQIAAKGGDPCEPCPPTGEPYCLSFQAVQIRANLASFSMESVNTGNIPATCPSDTWPS